MKRLFLIEISVDERTGDYRAMIDSLTDKKHASTKPTSSMKDCLRKMHCLVRAKTKQNNMFPLPRHLETLDRRNLVVSASN